MEILCKTSIERKNVLMDAVRNENVQLRAEAMSLSAKNASQEKEIAMLRSELDADVRRQLEMKDQEIARLTALLASDETKSAASGLSHHRRVPSTNSWSAMSDTWSEVEELEEELAMLESPNAPQFVMDDHREPPSATIEMDNNCSNCVIEERMVVPSATLFDMPHPE